MMLGAFSGNGSIAGLGLGGYGIGQLAGRQQDQSAHNTALANCYTNSIAQAAPVNQSAIIAAINHLHAHETLKKKMDEMLQGHYSPADYVRDANRKKLPLLT